MIERQDVEGRSATVAYLTADMQPVGKAKAELVKILFDDGEVRFAVQSHSSGSSPSSRS